MKSSPLRQLILFAAVAPAGSADGAGTISIVEEGIVAGAGSTELAILFDQDLDGDSGNTEGEQSDGEQDGRIEHDAKLRGRKRFE